MILKRLKNLKYLIFTILIFVVELNFGQIPKLYTGYFVDGSSERSPFKYSRIYQESGDTFVTIYHIFHPVQGYNYLDITATHYKSEKKIIVSVDDVSVKIGGHISTKVQTYETASMDWFGKRGSFQSQFDAQSALPNDLAIQFVTKKFENVNVINVDKGENSNTGGGTLKWYILDLKH